MYIALFRIYFFIEKTYFFYRKRLTRRDGEVSPRIGHLIRFSKIRKRYNNLIYYMYIFYT